MELSVKKFHGRNRIGEEKKVKKKRGNSLSLCSFPKARRRVRRRERRRPLSGVLFRSCCCCCCCCCCGEEEEERKGLKVHLYFVGKRSSCARKSAARFFVIFLNFAFFAFFRFSPPLLAVIDFLDFRLPKTARKELNKSTSPDTHAKSSHLYPHS